LSISRNINEEITSRIAVKKIKNLTRLDENRLEIRNDYGVKAVLFAGSQVPVEDAAVRELLNMLALKKTAELFYEKSPESFDCAPEITQVALMPDFHKAAGIPVGTVMATKGFVVPQAIGNDVNCGMRLHLTSLDTGQIMRSKDAIETAMRHVFFEGGRNIPMTRQQREALFLHGLTGLRETTPKELSEGIWRLYNRLDMEGDLNKTEKRGSLKAQRVFGLEGFLGEKNAFSRDSQIGSIGGGNHFVEIQVVKKIMDSATAYSWGVKQGMVTVMVHSGSVSIGHLSGNYYREKVREIYPASLQYPANKLFLLPLGSRHSNESRLFWDALNNAANFAFANRLFLALTALQGLETVCGESSFPLLYDAPHNYVWKTAGDDGEDFYIHRKGSCPARDMRAMADTAYADHGEPVLIPGSMGDASFIMLGQGNPESLFSASHGAGRNLSRGRSKKADPKAYQDFLERCSVVTPLDLRRQEVKMRPDIIDRKLKELMEEAPFCYKNIGPVVKTLEDTGIATPVAELEPLMTIKA